MMSKRHYQPDKKAVGLLFFFIGCMLVARYPSFTAMVINHDESTYLEIAREWLGGKSLYKEIIDIKPVGIFAILSFLQLIGIKSIFGIRLVSAIFLGVGAFLLNRLVFYWTKNDLSGIVAGLVFVLFNCFDFSLAINTETYFTLFLIVGMMQGIIGIDKRSKVNLFVSGLWIGLAFVTKYLALMEGVALVLMMLISMKKEKWKSIAWFVLGSSLPFVIVNACFWLAGNWDSFFFITYLAPFRYSAASDSDYFRIIGRMAVFFLPFLVSVPLLYKTKNKRVLLFIFIWLVCSFVAILLPQKSFKHYWIQLFAPISVLLGFSFSVFEKEAKKIILLPIAILLVIIGIKVNDMFSYFSKRDLTKEVIAYMSSVMEPDENIFCANYEQIMYYELEKNSPTPYVHKSILYNKKHQYTLGIEGKGELLKIVNQQPTYITIKDKYPVEWFQEYVETHYCLLKKIGAVSIFKRKSKTN